MREGYVKVVAAERIRVGHCHPRFSSRPKTAWRLWLACGHMESRTAEKPPRLVKCHNCEWDKSHGWKKVRDWKRGEIPNDFGVVRLDSRGKRDDDEC